MAEKEKREQESFRVEIDDVPKPRAFIPVTTSVSSSPALSIASYCAASILMTLANKYVLSGYHFNLNFFLLMIQNLICVGTIQAGKSLGMINFLDFKIEEGRKWFPISMLLIAMIYTGSKSIQYLSVPVYTIFKNLTIILIAYGEVLWFGASITKMVLLSFGLMVLSSVVAAWADITAALDSHGGNSDEAAQKLSTLNAGYIWMLVNCFSSAAYLLSMRKRIKLTNFKDFDTMFYNNLLSIPILFLCSLFLEDWSQQNFDRNFPKEIRSFLSVAIFFTGVSSLFISYCSAWCVRVTSSTTYSMVGALNKLPIALAGLVFFDAPVTVPSVSAIFLGFVAGLVYALGKMKQKVKSTILPMSASSQSVRDGFGQKS